MISLTRTKRLLNDLVPTTGKFLSLEEGRKAINKLSSENSQSNSVRLLWNISINSYLFIILETRKRFKRCFKWNI